MSPMETGKLPMQVERLHRWTFKRVLQNFGMQSSVADRL